MHAASWYSISCALLELARTAVDEYFVSPVALEAGDLVPDDMTGRVSGLQSELPNLLEMYVRTNDESPVCTGDDMLAMQHFPHERAGFGASRSHGRTGRPVARLCRAPSVSDG